MNLRGAIGGQVRDGLLYKGVPFFVAAACYWLGAPWYVVVGVLLSAQHWYGPVLVYLTQRMATLPSLRPLDAEATLPDAHRRLLQDVVPWLQTAGFVERGRFASADEKQSIRATGVLLQHGEASDLAHVLIATQDGRAGAAETLVFSRARTDGSWIRTARHTIPSPFPPTPSDSVLQVDARVDPLDLWRVHQARVAADTSAIRNVTVTDAFRFQMELERDGVRRHLASGLWQPDERPEFIRPTAHGAAVMCWRLLPPWKQATRLRARWQMRRDRRASRTR